MRTVTWPAHNASYVATSPADDDFMITDVHVISPDGADQWFHWDADLDDWISVDDVVAGS